ncbi:uncharacterized protein LOC143448818 isoform X2 [Clavelina lepadiformis]|uniref:uncharacterized protein LOC143448818 isoform X2 n=1 Tax=Clavelina lepadiformis TaxID=159417 RepID=UPI0040429D29
MQVDRRTTTRYGRTALKRQQAAEDAIALGLRLASSSSEEFHDIPHLQEDQVYITGRNDRKGEDCLESPASYKTEFYVNQPGNDEGTDSQSPIKTTSSRKECSETIWTNCTDNRDEENELGSSTLGVNNSIVSSFRPGRLSKEEILQRLFPEHSISVRGLVLQGCNGDVVKAIEHFLSISESSLAKEKGSCLNSRLSNNTSPINSNDSLQLADKNADQDPKKSLGAVSSEHCLRKTPGEEILHNFSPVNVNLSAKNSKELSGAASLFDRGLKQIEFQQGQKITTSTTCCNKAVMESKHVNHRPSVADRECHLPRLCQRKVIKSSINNLTIGQSIEGSPWKTTFAKNYRDENFISADFEPAFPAHMNSFVDALKSRSQEDFFRFPDLTSTLSNSLGSNAKFRIPVAPLQHSIIDPCFQFPFYFNPNRYQLFQNGVNPSSDLQTARRVSE